MVICPRKLKIGDVIYRKRRKTRAIERLKLLSHIKCVNNPKKLTHASFQILDNKPEDFGNKIELDYNTIRLYYYLEK